MQDSSEKRSHQRFDEQFKKEAVEMMLQSKKTLRQASRELGVNENNFRNWVEKYYPKASVEGGLSLQELQAENRRLRKELNERVEEVAILKKRRYSLRPTEKVEIRVQERHKSDHRIETMCRVLRVSVSGFYA